MRVRKPRKKWSWWVNNETFVNTYWYSSGIFNKYYCFLFLYSSLGFDPNVLFMPPRSKIGGILFLSCLSFCNSVILPFCPPLWIYNLADTFWTVSARSLIFHMNIPCDKTFPWETIIFDPVYLTLEFDPFFFFENFNLANNFWTVSAKTLIFHMGIPCDKTFL